jgi:N6-L-threonylcarbamoyladenine synthase
MKILGIESSCDETAASVVDFSGGKITVLSSLISSQVKIHAQYGGVVPEVAARLHIQSILPMIDLALQEAKVDWKKIDAIAVTAGPGLMSSLMIGVETAKTLAVALDKPLIRVNHIEGHLWSCLGKSTDYGLCADNTDYGATLKKVKFPAVALIVSGGHTQLIYVKDYLKYKLIGGTKDDAAGEAFDKTAKILELGYPGGPAISKAALNATGEFKIKLPRPMMDSKDFEMSFSGLKTAVLYSWKDLFLKTSKDNIEKAKAEMAKEFQQAVVDVLIGKTLKAAKKYKAQTIILGGGVSANGGLRGQLRTAIADTLPKVKVYFPEMAMTGDNAAMIAIAGYFHAKKKDFVSPLKLKADANWELV